MIRPLRRRHRRLFTALAVLLPVVFVVGIAVRKPVSVVAELPAALAPALPAFGFLEWERDDMFAKSPVQVRLLREQKNAGRFGIAFLAAKDFVKPDLIVYWVAGEPTSTETLLANAILLGSFHTLTLPIADEIATVSGRLMLYSLADGEIVDVSKLISFQPSNNLSK